MSVRLGKGRRGARLIEEFFGFGLGDPSWEAVPGSSSVSVSAPVAPWVAPLYTASEVEFVGLQLSLPYGGCSLAAVCALPDPHLARRLLKAWAWELSGYYEPVENQLLAISKRCPDALNRSMRRRVKLWQSQVRRGVA